MDDLGNILIKRLSKSPVYAKNTSEENALSNEIIKLQNGLLDYEKPFKLFDMKKFQQNVNREMKRQYPERNKLETQVSRIIILPGISAAIVRETWEECLSLHEDIVEFHRVHLDSFIPL